MADSHRKPGCVQVSLLHQWFSPAPSAPMSAALGSQLWWDAGFCQQYYEAVRQCLEKCKLLLRQHQTFHFYLNPLVRPAIRNSRWPLTSGISHQARDHLFLPIVLHVVYYSLYNTSVHFLVSMFTLNS